MPKITNFAFCEPGQFNDDLPQIKFIEGVTTASSLFGFAIFYSLTDFSRNEDHSVLIKIKDPHEVELMKTEEFLIEKSEDRVDESSITNLLNVGTMAIEFDDVEFKGQGLYKVELFFDNVLLNEFFLPVLLRKESE